MVESIDRWSFAQEILRIWTRSENGVDETDLDFSRIESLLDKIDIFPVAPGVLNLAPAEADLTIHSA